MNAKLQKAGKSISTAILVMVPLAWGIAIGISCYNHSNIKEMTGTYWVPKNFEILDEKPENYSKKETSFKMTLERFQEDFGGQRVLIFMERDRVTYFVKFGKTLIASLETPYKYSVDHSGTRYIGMPKFEKMGEVMFHLERSWGNIFGSSLVAAVFLGGIMDLLLWLAYVIWKNIIHFAISTWKWCARRWSPADKATAQV